MRLGRKADRVRRIIFHSRGLRSMANTLTSSRLGLEGVPKRNSQTDNEMEAADVNDFRRKRPWNLNAAPTERMNSLTTTRLTNRGGNASSTRRETGRSTKRRRSRQQPRPTTRSSRSASVGYDRGSDGEFSRTLPKISVESIGRQSRGNSSEVYNRRDDSTRRGRRF